MMQEGVDFSNGNLLLDMPPRKILLRIAFG